MNSEEVRKLEPVVKLQSQEETYFGVLKNERGGKM